MFSPFVHLYFFQLLSIYSLILSTRNAKGGSDVGKASDMSEIRAAMLKDEQREDDQLGMIRRLQETISNKYLNMAPLT